MRSESHSCCRTHGKHTHGRASSIIVALALGAFTLGMASYMTAGLLVPIGASLQISLQAAAQLVTAFTLAYGLASPVAVALLPPHRQREVLTGALLILIAANAASAMVDDYRLLLLLRAIAGTGAGVYLALSISASAALLPAGQAGKGIAWIMGGMASGTVLGVPLSLWLADWQGWRAAFWLTAALGAIAFIGLILKLPALPASHPSSLRQKMGLLTDRQTVKILAVSLLAAIASLGMYTFLAPFMRSMPFAGFSTVTLWLGIWGAGGICGSVLVGPLSTRLRATTLTRLIMTLLTLSLALLPVAAHLHLWLAAFPLFLWGAAGWALQVPQNHALLDVRKRYGDGNLAVALNESALYLGSAMGAIAGGLVVGADVSLWWLPVGAAAVAGSGLFVHWRSENR